MGGDEVVLTEASNKGAQEGLHLESSPGSLARGMREEKRRELGRPGRVPVVTQRVGFTSREGGESDARTGVRPLHSTLRRESRSHGEGSGGETQPATGT